MTRILIVCLGNICRSPMAEAVVREHVARAGFSSFVEIESAGTHAYEDGEPPDRRACQVALRRGYDLSGLRARRVCVEDFSAFDRILAMDRQNLAALARICPPEHLPKLALYLDPDEVPDPYYGNASGFEQVLDLCEQGARRLVATLGAGG